MDRLRIAVLFGGCSEEHDVSVKSAAEIASHMDTQKYAPLYIGITRSGVWRMCDFPRAGWDNTDCVPVIVSPDRGMRGILVLRDHRYEIMPVDVIFPVLHGKTGEDGAIQGLLEYSGIPYVGCDIPSSVVCMDKSLTYMIARDAGMATPDFTVLYPGDTPQVDTYPVFVKPARSGSSFGITKVSDAGGLAAAIQTARRYDHKILIEQAVTGIEVGCALLGIGAGITAGEVDQIRLTHGFFRIHQEANPEDGAENAVYTVPADIPAPTRLRVQATAKALYKALGCRGLARVDMFLQENGGIVLNEVNTMPGFTAYSRYPRMMAAAGISRTKLIDRLIMDALKD